MSGLQIAMFAGAGFSKAWGLPLANEIMDMQAIRTKSFPKKWQVELIDKVEAVWNDTNHIHGGVVDEFARMLQQSELAGDVSDKLSFEEFTSFLALRLSSEHWRVGAAHETKGGTGDHIRKQRSVTKGYLALLKGLKNQDLIGIVTTNYDLVIEKLIGPTDSGRLGGFNYGETGEALQGRHFTGSQWSYKLDTITGKIPLLKLNGSLNWAISPDGQVVKFIDARYSRGRTYPVLITPPATGVKHDKLQLVWDRAEQVLSTADIWIFCGYSIPDYDQAVRDLLRASAKNVRRVIILDTNPEPVRDKLRHLVSNSNRSIDICVGHGITSELDARDIASLIGLEPGV